MHILLFTFTLIKRCIYAFKATLAILKLKCVLLHFKRIGGFQNNFKSFDLVNFCTTWKL